MYVNMPVKKQIYKQKNIYIYMYTYIYIYEMRTLLPFPGLVGYCQPRLQASAPAGSEGLALGLLRTAQVQKQSRIFVAVSKIWKFQQVVLT